MAYRREMNLIELPVSHWRRGLGAAIISMASRANRLKSRDMLLEVEKDGAFNFVAATASWLMRYQIQLEPDSLKMGTCSTVLSLKGAKKILRDATECHKEYLLKHDQWSRRPVKLKESPEPEEPSGLLHLWAGEFSSQVGMCRVQLRKGESWWIKDYRQTISQCVPGGSVSMEKLTLSIGRLHDISKMVAAVTGKTMAQVYDFGLTIEFGESAVKPVRITAYDVPELTIFLAAMRPAIEG